MICRSNDPLADFDRDDLEAARDLKRFPICAGCGDPIVDEFCWLVGDELYHEGCVEMVRVDNYMKGE